MTTKVVTRVPDMTKDVVAMRDAKARLSELSDRAAAGEEIVITKHGVPVARLSAVKVRRKPVDLGRLRALTRRLPKQPESAGRWIRRLRDQARY